MTMMEHRLASLRRAIDSVRGSNRKADAEELEELARQLRRISDQADDIATFIRVELMP